ncbi:hypothetical protein Tco_1205722, partial [Tanacetum coccineum]
DEEVPVEDQPYVVADSPIALSPGYVADSDPVEDLEEDSEDGLADYLADGGDIDDDDSSDNDEEEEASEEEEEKHLALSDSVVAPVVDYVPSFEETESFETYESAATPPLPSSLHLPPHVPTSLPLPSSPLPPLPVSLFIPPPVDRREDIPEAELPPRERLCLTALTSRYEVGESSTAAPRPTRGHRADYRFIGTMDAEIRRQRAEEEQDTQDIYAVIEDDQEALVSQEAWAYSVGLSLTVHYELQVYKTHTQMQDYRIASQESLMTTLITHVSSLQGQLSVALGQIQNNMPPRRSSATARVVAAAAAAALITAAVVEQLIEARVSAALVNHNTL